MLRKSVKWLQRLLVWTLNIKKQEYMRKISLLMKQGKQIKDKLSKTCVITFGVYGRSKYCAIMWHKLIEVSLFVRNVEGLIYVMFTQNSVKISNLMRNISGLFYSGREAGWFTIKNTLNELLCVHEVTLNAVLLQVIGMWAGYKCSWQNEA